MCEQTYPHRHRVIVEVSETFLKRFFVPTDKGEWWQILKGIPADSIFIDANFDSLRGAYRFCWEHPSFEKVKEAELLPSLNIIIRSRFNVLDE